VIHPAVSDALVSQVDMVPTILTLCGAPAYDGLQGHDLAPLLIGQKAERPDSVYVEGKLGEKDEWRMIVFGMDKLVVDAAGEATHLFNLAEDPYEMINLAHDSSVKLKRDQLLAQYRASRQRLLDFKRR
jgi:arylsulfatase A-like enzyme